jgi:signal transduction histidine kinase
VNLKRFQFTSGDDHRAWPVILLLLAAVMVPTACVLWFMNKAMQNERLAIRQKLVDAYRGQLTLLQTELGEAWNKRIQALEKIASENSSAVVFLKCVQSGLAESVICFSQTGEVTYPTQPNFSGKESTDPLWFKAKRQETSREYLVAAESYASFGQRTSNSTDLARALQAQVRCLARGGQMPTALEIVTKTLSGDQFRQATDLQGRLIVPNAQLLALEFLKDPSLPEFRETAGRLSQRLLDYEDATLTAAQRRFLMRELQSLLPGGMHFPTLSAEILAARYLESRATGPKEPVLRPTQLPGVWQFTLAERRVLVLQTTTNILAQMQSLISSQDLGSDVCISLLPPSDEVDTSFVALAAGASLPGWKLALTLKDRKLLEAAAAQQNAAYIWTGVLVIVAMSVLAAIAARIVRRQLAVARLKNDLVATVSHELKTPLSSMRLLVDTLLDTPKLNERTVREYLELIAQENTRLSRLIDNFLMFSRMERNKYSFKFREVRPNEITDLATAAVKERFQTPDCHFELDIPPGLPFLNADSDALSTALINLLDNAYKYTDGEKRITLRASAQNGQLCFAVRDNGIGLTPSETKKIFRRFYQVDQRLSRNSSGCGLGLSIVEFIMNAHGGSVRVESEPGKGSTFTLSIPAGRVQENTGIPHVA